jgi:hypothetical protein
MSNIFDTLKRITISKDNWEDIPEEEQEGYNKYMVARFLSMDKDYCELVNIINKNSWQIPSSIHYKIYKDLIPTRQVFLKYMKPANKKDYKSEILQAIQQQYEISRKEAVEYCGILSKEEQKQILENQGK